MPNYDFSSLSSFDFELLVRDLMQLELNNITLESFKSGRDGGIDLRYSKDKVNGIIIQCKHYAKSKYNDLLTSIKKEIPKLQVLKPKRYILVTSMGLTPANKTEISNLISPYIHNTGDIFGVTDLNNLLGKYPEIEKRHFKLWLSSEAILSKILHNDIYNLSNMGIENIKDKVKYYVQNKSFTKAKKILDDNNYCIIAGAPGIGKTTLAEILIFDYLAHGFGVFKISNVSDAFKVYSPKQRQVFYFDDFLGQTSLESKLNNNEDDNLITFIDTVKKTKNTKFILTTREYILNQAKIIYEKLSNSDFDYYKCVIDLSDYTTFNKAQILYNHLYFSDLSRDNLKQILEKKNYFKIINHPNYSPRIIQWVTKINNIEDPNFFGTFISNLNNPHRLWSHAFEYQLSEVAQKILILLSTLTEEVMIDDLKKALETYDNNNGLQTSNIEFRKALRQIEGNFIQIRRIGNESIISYSNPSIRDFIENYLNENFSELRKLCTALYFFDQHISLWNNKKCNKQLCERLSNQFLNSIITKFSNKTYRISNHIRKDNINKEDRFVFITGIIPQLNVPLNNINFIEIENQIFMDIQKGNIGSWKIPTILKGIRDINFQIGKTKLDWINAIKNKFLNELDQFDTFDVLNQIDNIIPGFLNLEEMLLLKEKFNELIELEHNYYLNDEKEKDYIEGFSSALEEVSDFLGIESQSKLDLLAKKIKKLEEEADEDDYSDYEYDSWRESRLENDNSSSIDALFDLLRE